ncbi:hypothetical protein [Mycoplasma buteonis]|uniref:hypothetical protein n=1 Tax=Mycoplasma buteonis TaxID=171280 RepID=UPI00055F4A6C|nr:hypothetical protein [Mycoplasma buteonis]
MKINFKSIIRQNEQEQTIQFDSPVTITDENGFKVFSFTEPSLEVENRIEISDKEINIYAGSSTVHLKKDEKTEFNLDLTLDDGKEYSFTLVSNWYKSNFQDPNFYSFEYSLAKSFEDEDLIGSYHIELTITE